jgi:putative membrane protein
MRENTDATRRLLLVVALVILLPVATMLFAGPTMGTWGDGHMWGGSGGPWLWSLLWSVPLLFFLGAGYLLYRASLDSDGTDAALEQLRVAYAQGDLSEEEFETRRERLRRREEN